MSISRTVYLRRSSVLAPTAWADAIRAAGFAMDLDTDFAIESHSGFLPCTYDGKEGGFEYDFTAVSEKEIGEDTVKPAIGDRDTAITFVTHSSMRGLVTAVVAAAVLCEKTDGVLHDEESDEFIAARDALADARELVASVADDLD